MMRSRPPQMLLLSLIAVSSAATLHGQEASVVFRVVSASLMEHTCALTGTGRAYCWGLNSSGQLGTDSARDECKDEGERHPCSNQPLPVVGGLAFASLTSGSFHTCGLTADGLAYCWGLNNSGQLGTDSSADLCRTWATLACSKKPLPVAGGLTFAALAAGSFHTCGITRIRLVYCWGENSLRQLGADMAPDSCQQSVSDTTSYSCSRVPLVLPGGLQFTAISAAHPYTCGVTTDSLLYCWGTRDGLAAPSTVALVPGTQSLRFTSVSVGGGKVCAVAITAAVYCWGAWNQARWWRDVNEQPRSPGASSRKGQPSGEWRAAAVTTGGEHACSLSAAGEAYCWGDGREGQLGIGGREFASQPVRVSDNSVFASLSAGGGHTCGVTTAGTVLCWGAGSSGQLGNGETGRKRTPEPVITSAMRRRS